MHSNLTVGSLRGHFTAINDPATWYGINYAGKQVTPWNFQNKGKSGWTGTSFFGLEVPLCSLCPSTIYSVTCDESCKGSFKREPIAFEQTYLRSHTPASNFRLKTGNSYFIAPKPIDSRPTISENPKLRTSSRVILSSFLAHLSLGALITAFTWRGSSKLSLRSEISLGILSLPLPPAKRLKVKQGNVGCCDHEEVIQTYACPKIYRK